MERDWYALAIKAGVPEATAGALDRYLSAGIPTGGFLRAFLANDLMEAVGRADEDNTAAFKCIASFVYMDMPSTAHGSYDAVDRWMSERISEREERSNA